MEKPDANVGDCFIILRADGTTEIGIPEGKVLEENGILAFALKFALENDEWVEKVKRRAYIKIKKAIRESRPELLNRKILEG